MHRVFFSQDDDLLSIANNKQDNGVFFTGLIYGHQLSATIGKFVIDLELICTVLNAEDIANRIEYLPFGSSI